MIIKSTRIQTASGPGAIAHHILRGRGNERIDLVWGGDEAMRTCMQDASINDRKYGLRHWTINPDKELTIDQLRETIKEMASEFGFDNTDPRITLVRHAKKRHGAERSTSHYHLVVPEELQNGKVMSNKNDYARHEKISRTLEQRFGHDLKKGRHNRAVAAVADPVVAEAVRDGGLTEGAPARGDRHVATEAVARRTTGKGLSARIENAIHGWERAGTWADFVTDREAAGWRLEERTSKAGRQAIVMIDETGTDVGAVTRVLGLRAAEVRRLTADPHAVIHGRERAVPESAAEYVPPEVETPEPPVGQWPDEPPPEIVSDVEAPAPTAPPDAQPQPQASGPDRFAAEVHRVKIHLEAVIEPPPHPEYNKPRHVDRDAMRAEIKPFTDAIKKKLAENRREIIDLRREIQELDNRSWLAKKMDPKEKEKKEMEERLKKLFTELAEKIRYLFETIRYRLVGGEPPVPPHEILTDSERDRLIRDVKANKYMQLLSKGETFEEGVKQLVNHGIAIREQRIEDHNRQHSQRDDVMNAEREYTKLDTLMRDDLDESVDEQCYREIQKYKQTGDLPGAVEALRQHAVRVRQEAAAYREREQRERREAMMERPTPTPSRGWAPTGPGGP